jgi:hypothetical protein
VLFARQPGGEPDPAREPFQRRTAQGHRSAIRPSPACVRWSSHPLSLSSSKNPLVTGGRGPPRPGANSDLRPPPPVPQGWRRTACHSGGPSSRTPLDRAGGTTHGRCDRWTAHGGLRNAPSADSAKKCGYWPHRVVYRVALRNSASRIGHRRL